MLVIIGNILMNIRNLKRDNKRNHIQLIDILIIMNINIYKKKTFWKDKKNEETPIKIKGLNNKKI